jgi:hypothetical protein
MNQELPSKLPLAFLLPVVAANVVAESVGPELATTEEQEALAADPEADQTAAVAEALANPLSSLWIMFAQNDTIWMDGDTLDNVDIATGTVPGPMALAVNITDNWVFGAVAQHWWSFAVEDTINVQTSQGKIQLDRLDVNLTDFQYIIRYRYSALTNIGATPNIKYNWETDEISLPIGIGF